MVQGYPIKLSKGLTQFWAQSSLLINYEFPFPSIFFYVSNEMRFNLWHSNVISCSFSLSFSFFCFLWIIITIEYFYCCISLQTFYLSISHGITGTTKSYCIIHCSRDWKSIKLNCRGRQVLFQIEKIKSYFPKNSIFNYYVHLWVVKGNLQSFQQFLYAINKYWFSNNDLRCAIVIERQNYFTLEILISKILFIT